MHRVESKRSRRFLGAKPALPLDGFTKRAPIARFTPRIRSTVALWHLPAITQSGQPSPRSTANRADLKGQVHNSGVGLGTDTAVLWVVHFKVHLVAAPDGQSPRGVVPGKQRVAFRFKIFALHPADELLRLVLNAVQGVEA